ncbi:MAG: SGNH/GDSL hydrolase family protein [Polyangiaceae bacterium]|nr:SGNH/GDSL hydrolase family protein [Polyangiaceae bacterium]
MVRTVLGIGWVVIAAGCSASDGGGAGAGGSGAQAGAGASAGAGGAAGAASGGSAGSGGVGASAGVGGASGAAGGAGTGGAGAGGSGTGGAGTGGYGPSKALPALGALVVLGDSISDGGGQGPYYYNLLRADLEAKYGALAYQRKAQGGSKTGALSGQIDSLPSTLPGPVAVCITSGGNDMKDVLVQVATGTDGPARTQMGNNITSALNKLLAPGRFGAGVAVHVFEADIYDASDGQGNYAAHGCNFAGNFPALPTDGYFASWNGEIKARVEQAGQTYASIHALFRLHGFNHPPSWYASDCTHPTSTGHDQLRRFFYYKISGDLLP